MAFNLKAAPDSSPAPPAPPQASVAVGRESAVRRSGDAVASYCYLLAPVLDPGIFQSLAPVTITHHPSPIPHRGLNLQKFPHRPFNPPKYPWRARNGQRFLRPRFPAGLLTAVVKTRSCIWSDPEAVAWASSRQADISRDLAPVVGWAAGQTPPARASQKAS
jgi:hypothetical protein